MDLPTPTSRPGLFTRPGPKAIGVALFVYILGSSANAYFFHFVLDVNLAKVGTLAAICVFWLAVTKEELLFIWSGLKWPIVLTVGWTLYLLLNGYFGATPFFSLKLTLRFVGAFLVAFPFALILRRKQENRRAILGALLAGLVVINIVWFGMRQISEFSPDFVRWFPNQKLQYSSYAKFQDSTNVSVAVGLFQNPNALGWALTTHLIATLALVAVFEFPWQWVAAAYLLAVPGVVYSGSRNSFLGLAVTTILLLPAILQRIVGTNFAHRKRLRWAALVCGSVAICAFAYWGPDQRALKTASQVYEAVEKFGSDDFDLRSESHKILGLRMEIVEESFGFWKREPWIGYGLGSYLELTTIRENVPHHEHNFFLATLFGQGVVGFLFFSAFIVAVLFAMKSVFGSLMLISFGSLQLFDKLTYSYIFPVYTSIILAICFYLALARIENGLVAPLKSAVAVNPDDSLRSNHD